MLRRGTIQERILALPLPVIRDLIAGCKFVSRVVATESVLRWYPWHSWNLFSIKSCGFGNALFHDGIRILECIGWYLDVKLKDHYTQWSPLEYLSIVQFAWLERFKEYHAACSSRRRAENFALIIKLEDDDLENDIALPDIEGNEVEVDLRQQDKLECMERIQYNLDKDSFYEALCRE